MKLIKIGLYCLGILAAATNIIGLESQPKRLTTESLRMLASWAQGPQYTQHHDAKLFLETYNNPYRFNKKNQLKTPLIVFSNFHKIEEDDVKHAKAENILAITNYDPKSLHSSHAAAYWKTQSQTSRSFQALTMVCTLGSALISSIVRFSSQTTYSTPIHTFYRQHPGYALLGSLIPLSLSIGQLIYYNHQKSYDFKSRYQHIKHPNRPKEHITLFSKLTKALSNTLIDDNNKNGNIFTTDKNSEPALTFYSHETIR